MGVWVYVLFARANAGPMGRTVNQGRYLDHAHSAFRLVERYRHSRPDHYAYDLVPGITIVVDHRHSPFPDMDGNYVCGGDADAKKT